MKLNRFSCNQRPTSLQMKHMRKSEKKYKEKEKTVKYVVCSALIILY